jgi:lactate permease
MQYSAMTLFLAAIPILLILYLMIGRRWGAARAGGIGYLSALVISITFFGAGPLMLAYAQANALLLAVDVLVIIWAAFFFYQVCDQAGAIKTIGQALPRLTADRAMQGIIIGWVFASFLQGAGGFGVPVAVTAPILVSLGFSPVVAIVLPSIGHGWAVNFGSLGSSFQALINASGTPASELTQSTAIMLGFACLLTGPMIAHAAGGWTAVRRLWAPILGIGLVMASLQYILAVWGPWNIAALGAAMAGLVSSVFLAVVFRKQNESTGTLDRKGLLIAFSGYALLILIILIAQFVPIVKENLSKITLQVKFPETVTSLGFITPAAAGRKISVFGHTGALLFYASLMAYLLYYLTGRYRPDSHRKIINGTLQRVMSSSVSILSMVSMAVIMERSGMTEALALGLASGLTTLFPLISPWIGALGAFMTGSNTNSNLVFGALQRQTAELLGFSLAVILAAQTVGGSIGSTAAPTKVIVGASTAGMAGREGEILRSLFGYIAFLIAMISLLAVLGILITQ